MSFVNRSQFIILYGECVYTIAKTVEKLYQRQTRIEPHIMFLKECKEMSVILEGLTIRTNTNTNRNSILLNETMKKTRDNVLKYRYKQLKLNSIELNTQKKF